jgi:polyhydroxyalkanoate synthesis regulator phasin
MRCNGRTDSPLRRRIGLAAASGGLLIAAAGMAAQSAGERAEIPNQNATGGMEGRNRVPDNTSGTGPAGIEDPPLRPGLRPLGEVSRSAAEVDGQVMIQARMVRDRVNECLESHLEKAIANRLGKSRAEIESILNRIEAQALKIQQHEDRIYRLERQVHQLEADVENPDRWRIIRPRRARGE